MPSFLSRTLRFILKLALVLLAAVFAVSLLLAALIALALSLLKSLITGRKPVPAMVFSRFQKFSSPVMWPGDSAREGATGASSAGEVVDVQAREVRDDRRLP